MQSENNSLLTPDAIRLSCKQIYDNALAGGTHFFIDEHKFKACASLLNDNIDRSTWDLLKVGGINRLALLNLKIAKLDTIEQARIKVDLILVSILFDVELESDWTYSEDSLEFNHSAGIFVACFHMFSGGHFSSLYKREVDAKALMGLCLLDIKGGFQVSQDNSLDDLEDRVNRLNVLGQVCSDDKYFSMQRPGSILDYLISTLGNSMTALDILSIIHTVFLPALLGSRNIEDQSLQAIIPLYQLAQKITYSLVLPLEECGIEIIGIDELTSSVELYHRQSLFESGVVGLRTQDDFDVLYRYNPDFVTEWKALATIILDKIRL
jgi:hypothetical protein